MKKILLLLFIAVISFNTFAQTNAMVKGVVSFNTDSASFKSTVNSSQASYGPVGALYYNKQSNKWRVFYDSAWHDLLTTSGGSTFNADTLLSTDTVKRLVVASAILRPVSTGVGGSPITWEMLGTVDGHKSVFFTSVTTVGSNIVINYPTVSKVVNFTVTSDETLASKGIRMGASVGLSFATISGSMDGGIQGGWLVGTGTGTFFTKSGNLSLFDMQLVDAGRVNFNAPLLGGTLAQNGSFQTGVAINYTGSNNYRIRRITGGLGAYNFGFEIIDNATNLKITTNSTSDIVDILTTTPKLTSLNLNVNDSSGYPFSLLTSLGNLWIFAVFQL